MLNRVNLTNYDGIVTAYTAEREALKSGKYIQKLLKELKPNASILDLGCGAGVPVDDILVKHGHSVTGLDVSEEMVKTARKKVKGGSFAVRDIGEIKPEEFQADAVISLYAIFHLPRNRHGNFLKTVVTFLPKGGLLLITMGDKDYEGTTTFHGKEIWWSQWGPVKNRELVEKAGLEIQMEEMDTSGGERHQVIMARKK